LLKHHLIQLSAENQIQFRHQLLQEYYAAERLLEEIAKLSDDELQWEYLNYLKWTEVVALMSGLFEDEAQVINLLESALNIDCRLCAKLVRSIKRQFQEQSVEFIFDQRSIPLINKIIVLGETKSDYAIPYLIAYFEAAFEAGYYLPQKFVIKALKNIGSDAAVYELLAIIEEHIIDLPRILKNEFFDITGFEVEVVAKDALNALEDIFRLNKTNNIIKNYFNLLKHEDYLIRVSAALELFRYDLINDDIYFKYCLPVLKHKNIYTRRTAIQLLAPNNNEFAIFPLIQATNDESYEVCQAAIERLADFKNQDVIVRLGELLHSEDLRVRKLAFDSLEKIGGEDIVPVLCSFIQDNIILSCTLLQNDNFNFISSIERKLLERAFRILENINNTVLTNICNSLLNNEEVLFHWLASYKLWKIDNLDIETAIDAFCQFINHTNFSIVIETVSNFTNYKITKQNVSKLKDDFLFIISNNYKAYLSLVKTLNSNNLAVRIEAIKALATFDNQEVIPVLKQALNDDDYEVRLEVIKALKSFGITQLIAIREQVLNDENCAVRRSYFETIKKYDSEYVFPILSKIIEDCSQKLPKILSNHELDLLTNGEWNLLADAVRQLNCIGSENSIAILHNLLQSKEESIHALSAFQLWELNLIDKDILVTALLNLFRHNNPNLRKAAIEGLEAINSDKLINVVSQTIDDDNYKVRLQAVESLKKYNFNESIPLLLQFIEDENYQVRKEAIVVLSKYGRYKVIPILIESLDDEVEEVVIAAIKALSYFNDDKMVMSLIEKLENNNNYSICEAIIDSLIVIGKKNNLAIAVFFSWFNNYDGSEFNHIIIKYLENDYQNLSLHFISLALINNDVYVHRAAIEAARLVDSPQLLPYLYRYWIHSDLVFGQQWRAIDLIQESCKYYKPIPKLIMSNTSHNYALLIGVGECEETKLSLPVTVKDIQALKSLLTDSNLCGYIDSNIRLLYNETATKEKILENFNWLKQQAENDPEATILIYYSGHGCLDNSGNYYLIPHETDRADIPDTALSAETINQALQEIPAQRLLVIIDSCHAQGMATSKDAKSPIPKGFTQTALPKTIIDNLKGVGRVVFTSSTGEQLSWIRSDRTMSIYTYHFLEALQGAGNQPGDKVVKVSHLMNYLSKTVPITVQKEYNKEQTPFFDFATEDFPVALLRGGKGLPEAGYDVKAEAEENIRSISNQVKDGVGIVGNSNIGLNIGQAGNITIGDISSK
jgi:HEAT repeat protein